MRDFYIGNLKSIKYKKYFQSIFVFLLGFVLFSMEVFAQCSTPILIDSVNVTQPTCTQDGVIVVNATGGGETLEYSFDNGLSYQTANTFSGPSGSYDVIVRYVTDTTCAVSYASNPVLLNSISPPILIDSVNLTQPTCTQDGVIVVNATGGGETLEYSFDNGLSYQTANTFSGPSGSYDVIVRYVTDTTCTVSYASNPVLLNSISPPIVSTSLTQPTCSSPGQIVVNATASGSQTLMYSINGGSTFQASNIFNNLSSGTYNIVVRYASPTDCLTSITETLIEPSGCSYLRTAISSCNQGYTKDGQYKIVYKVTVENTSYFENVYDIQMVNDLRSIFGNIPLPNPHAIVEIENISMSTTNRTDIYGHAFTFPLEYNGSSINTTEFDNLDPTPGADGILLSSAVTDNTLYPRQYITFNYCIYINPAIAGGLNVGSGNGVTFNNIFRVSNSINGGTPQSNVSISDFHTTETTVAAELFVPNNTPLVNFDGTYDFTNKVVVTNDGSSTAYNVQYYLPMNAFVNDGIPLNTYVVTQISGPATAVANASYNGTTVNGIMATGSSLAPGETAVYKITYNVGPTTYSNWNYWGTPNPSMTQGSPDGYIENPNYDSYVEWSDAEGNHMDRFYQGASSDNVASSLLQCSCPGYGMRFPYTVGINLVKSITSNYPAASGVSGNRDIVFRLVVSNNATSNVQVDNLVLNDDLTSICSASNIISVQIPQIVGSTALVDPNINIAYNGLSDIAVFDGTSGILEPGQQVIVEFKVEMADTCVGQNKANYSAQDPNNLILAFITSSVPVSILTPIYANDDTGTDLFMGIGGTAVINVLHSNGNNIDTLDSAPATTSNVILSQVGSWPAGISLNTSTGEVNVAPGTPAGTYNLTYQICQTTNNTNCDTAIITFNVIDDTPVAEDDYIITNEDSSISGTVVINDTPSGDGSNVWSLVGANGGALHGTVTMNQDGTYNYTPNPNFNGSDTFVYQICDADGDCESATVTITVNPVNDVPVAIDDTATTPEDTPVTIAVLGNDTDVENGIVPSSVVTTDPAHGTVTVNPNGTVVYTPDPNFNGVDTFEYTVCDNGTPVYCDTALVTVTVTSVNDAPVVNDASATTDEDTPVTVCLPISDIDTGSTFTASVCGEPANGTLGTPTVNGNEVCVTYTPNANYNGTNTFCIQVCDNGSPALCDTALVTVTVNPVNDTPVAIDDTATTPEDTPVTIAVLGNDTDVENGLVPSSVVTTDPAHGTVTVNPNGTVVYTPDANFNGVDTFEYIVCDNGTPVLCDTALVTVTVTSVNDAPVVNDASATTNEDTQVTVCLPISDVDTGSTFTASVCGEPTNGTLGTPTVSGNQVCVTYTPAANYNGTDTFCIEVCDSGTPILCDTATVTVTVTPVNDAPVIPDTPVTTPEDTPIEFCIPISDIDAGSTFTANVCGDPTHGTISTPIVSAGQVCVTYTPNENYNGTDTFCVQVCDNGTPILCDNATVTVTVTPVNDTPVIPDTSVTTAEDTPIEVCIPISDVDAGSTFTASVCGEPTNGTLGTPTVSGNQVCVTYTPAANYNGTDTFCIEVCDNGTPLPLCDTALVTVTVNPVNDAPVAIDDTATTPEDTPVTIAVLGNDTDVENGIVPSSVVTTDPAHGTVTVNPDGTVVYTPDANFNGVDTFEYIVCDNGTPVLCDTALVTVTVTAVNDAPVVNDASATTNEDTPVTVCLPISDIDTGSTFTASVCGEPTNGTLGTPTVSGNQVCVTYTPAANYNGTDTFCIEVCDNGTPLPLCDTALVTVTVNPVNDAPVAIDDTATTPEDTPVTIAVLGNDTDVENGLVPSSVVTTDPAHGTVTVNPNGTVVYTPDEDFFGVDTFEYIVCDNGTPVLCDTALVTVTVTSVNDAPVVNDASATTNEDSPVTVCLPISDIDTGSTFTASVCGTPTNGTLGTPTVNGNEVCVTYTPNENYIGTDTFCIEVCDNGTPLPLCDTALVTVTVNPVNDAPVAIDDTATTPEDTPVTIAVLGNDTDVENGIVPSSVVTTDPAHGTVTVNPNGTVVYTPDEDFFGVDTFEYTVCDNGTPVLCDTALVTVTVTSVNDAPVVNDASATTNEDSPVTVCLPISDIDTGSTFTASVCGTPTNGTLGTPTVNGNEVCVTYTPNENYIGTDTFCIEVCDNGTPLPLCDTALVTVTVNPVNDTPVAIDDTATTPEDTPVIINVLGNDTDVENGIVPSSVVTTDPAHGTVTVNPNGTVVYIPDEDFFGVDTFEYIVCDNGTPVLCDTALVTVTVTAVNDAPVVNDASVTTNEDTQVTVCLPISDIDTGSTFTASVCGEPTNGTLGTPTVNGNEVCVTYTPNENYIGTDTFCIEVCDNGTPLPLCDTALVTVTVNPVNDTPVAIDDTATTPEDTPVIINVLGNDTDVENGIVPSSVVTTDPAHGTVTVNPNGTVVYIPDEDFFGVDTFEYIVCDNGTPVLCDTALVTVTVTAVNDAPIAEDDEVETDYETPIVIDVLDNDFDVEGLNPTSVTIVDQPDHGIVTVNPTTGEITYIPGPNFTGIDTFDYSVCDYGTPVLCDIATVTVVVNAIDLIPDGFSPNGDNYNDTWEIPYLAQFPDFKLEVYDRWGNIVYDYSRNGASSNAIQWWDGKSNGRWIFEKGEILPAGTYFYIINPNQGDKQPFTGWVYLNR